MKSIEIVSKKVTAKRSVSVKDAMAKKVLLTMLARLKIGHLTLEDDGEVFAFGQDKKTATVIAHINVSKQSVYGRVLLGGTIGSAEAYMAHERFGWAPIYSLRNEHNKWIETQNY